MNGYVRGHLLEVIERFLCLGGRLDFRVSKVSLNSMQFHVIDVPTAVDLCAGTGASGPPSHQETLFSLALT